MPNMQPVPGASPNIHTESGRRISKFWSAGRTWTYIQQSVTQKEKDIWRRSNGQWEDVPTPGVLLITHIIFPLQFTALSTCHGSPLITDRRPNMTRILRTSTYLLREAAYGDAKEEWMSLDATFPCSDAFKSCKSNPITILFRMRSYLP